MADLNGYNCAAVIEGSGGVLKSDFTGYKVLGQTSDAVGYVNLSSLSVYSPAGVSGASRTGGHMSTLLIHSTEVVNLRAILTSTAGVVMTGATVVVQITRASDDYPLDWNDLTFKASGWTTRQASMGEVDATFNAGAYKKNLDFGAITNKFPNDTYYWSATTTGAVPFTGEVKCAPDFDRISSLLDTTVSSRATAATAAAAVVDQALSGHTTAGTVGKALSLVDVATSTLATAAALASNFATTSTGISTLISNVAALPAAVWDYSINGIGNTSKAGGALTVVRQLSTNRLESTPGNPGHLVLYADDGTTVRLTYTLRDYTGGLVVDALGSPARRSAGA